MWVAKEGRENRGGKKGIDDLRWSDGKKIEFTKREFKTASVKGELHHAFQKPSPTLGSANRELTRTCTRRKDKVCAVKAS